MGDLRDDEIEELNRRAMARCGVSEFPGTPAFLRLSREERGRFFCALEIEIAELSARISEAHRRMGDW